MPLALDGAAWHLCNGGEHDRRDRRLRSDRLGIGTFGRTRPAVTARRPSFETLETLKSRGLLLTDSPG